MSPRLASPLGRIVILLGLLVAVLGVTRVASARGQAPPDDPFWPQQWGLEKINALRGWQVSRGEDVVVAVVDSGVDLDHPDLAGAFVRGPDGRVTGQDFVDSDDDPTDEHGHGTMVAGIVAARTGNGQGVAAVAPHARLLPVRVLDEHAAGSSADVDAGIRWAVDHGADVINLSLEVARERSTAPVPLLEPHAPAAAVRYAWTRGAVVVAAAGNDSSRFTDYPDDTPALVVGATDRQDDRALFTDTGRRDAVFAPGIGIVSTWCDPCGVQASHTVGQSDGTSYAAAHVAGAVALLRAHGLGPETTVRRIRQTAVDLGPSGPDSQFGYGRIDVAAALGSDTLPAGSPTRALPTPTPSRHDAGRATSAVPTPPPGPKARVPAPVGSDGSVAGTRPSPTAEPSRTSPPATEGFPQAGIPLTESTQTLQPRQVPGSLTALTVALLAINSAGLAWWLHRRLTGG